MQAVLEQPTASVSNLIKEKEKLQSDLERALTDIDQLKVLLAQNTLITMHTQEDDYAGGGRCVTDYSPYGKHNDQNNQRYQSQAYQSRNETVNDNPMSRSFTLGNNSNTAQHRSKSQNRVPGLDFSNLKQVKDYKDWYAYAKKLEDALSLLRARIKLLEDENLDLTAKLEKTLQQCEQLHQQNLDLQDSLKKEANKGAVSPSITFNEQFDTFMSKVQSNSIRRAKRFKSVAHTLNKKNLTL